MTSRYNMSSHRPVMVIPAATQQQKGHVLRPLRQHRYQKHAGADQRREVNMCHRTYAAAEHGQQQRRREQKTPAAYNVRIAMHLLANLGDSRNSPQKHTAWKMKNTDATPRGLT